MRSIFKFPTNKNFYKVYFRRKSNVQELSKRIVCQTIEIFEGTDGISKGVN